MKCLSNIRAIATASMTYAADDHHEEVIPAGVSEDPSYPSVVQSRLGNYAYGGKSGIGGPSVSQMNGASVYGWGARMGSAHRPLNRITYKSGFSAPVSRYDLRDTKIDVDMYKCPSDAGFQGNHYKEWYDTQLTSYDHFGTSYSANVFWIGRGGGGSSLNFMFSNSAYLRSLSGVPAPANTILYIENVGRYCWNQDDPYPGITFSPQPPYPERLGGPKWHQQGWYFNATFCDGHATYIKVKSYIPFDRYPTNMAGICANGGCQYIMIRGRGWQWDTLPAAPIESKHPCPDSGRPSQDGVDLIGWPTG
jgi:prepilin-type processing-associated H-X9-DG protein